MIDTRIAKFAKIIVDHSTHVQSGDRVAITATTAAELLVKTLYELILDRGGHPHLLLEFPGQEEVYLAHAGEKQLDFLPLFHQMAFEHFEVLIKIRAELNPRSLSNVDPSILSRRQKGLAPLLAAQLQRGAINELRWLSTLYPTNGYAMEAEMGLIEYQDFVFQALHADDNTTDPIGYWQKVEKEQSGILDKIVGSDEVVVRGTDVDLKLSIKNRKFINACGKHNLPDGEIYTGPVENSAMGWVRYTFPAIYQGKVVEGIELTFAEGRVIKATAKKNQDFLLHMLQSDSGASYIGEFAIGTNFEINRFTHNILYDEKIGGSFHMALGAGYPETGSLNKSVIHWDMICDLRNDSEILTDGEVIYRNGHFTI